jgi:hypothetical protein
LEDCQGVIIDGCLFTENPNLIIKGTCNGLQIQNSVFGGGAIHIQNMTHSSALIAFNRFYTPSTETAVIGVPPIA